MDSYERHKRIWRILYGMLGPIVRRMFGLSCDVPEIDGTVLLISNHVTAWDPILVGLSLHKKQVYYAASEHLFRLGLLTKFIVWAADPVPRRKAASGVDTVIKCRRHLDQGHSVCIFAEGEQSWDGLSIDVFSATGKLAKGSGVTLATMCIEGGYLSCPRWSKTVRRGKVHCRLVGLYSAEQLKTMKPREITAQINRDIFENAWERQSAEPVEYRGRRLAEGLERMLYLCPECRKIGGLHTKGDRIRCTCGMERRYLTTGLFSPSEPFSQLYEWDIWERERLKERDFVHDELLFSDSGLTLVRLGGEHEETLIAKGEMRQYEDRLEFAEHTFPMDDIKDMALVLTNRLLFSIADNYYEVRTKGTANLRKYHEFRLCR